MFEVRTLRTIEDNAVRAKVRPGELRRWLGKCVYCKAPHSFLGLPVEAEIIPRYGSPRWEHRIATEGGVVLEGCDNRPVGPCRNGCLGKDSGRRATVVFKLVLGKYNAHKPCNTRCLSATGPACECSCAGRNHGSAH